MCPRCDGALHRVYEEPYCRACGWVDYSFVIPPTFRRKTKPLRHLRLRKASQRKIDSVRAWQRANPVKERARRKRYRLLHPDRIHEEQKRWKKANPEKVRAQKQRARMRKRTEGIPR